MKKIKLTGKYGINKYAIVDSDTFEKLSKYSWHVSVGGYPTMGIRQRGVKIRKTDKFYMHQLIMDTPKGLYTDHINGDKLDNRKSNLRICTNQQNSSNRKTTLGKTSKYKGVRWIERLKKWNARITYKYKGIYLGLFDTECNAAKAYNQKAQELFGEFALLNKV